jgi:hypothetical protein
MNEYEQLAKSIQIAANEHDGQFDKAGKPYLLHPLHLMSQLLFDPQLATIAVLHDVIEDTCMTIDELSSAGFSKRVTDAVYLLTHKDGDSYGEYIAKICMNYDAIRVKRKDLEHNSDITRLKGVTDKDIDRMIKYHDAFIELGEEHQ